MQMCIFTLILYIYKFTQVEDFLNNLGIVKGSSFSKGQMHLMYWNWVGLSPEQ